MSTSPSPFPEPIPDETKKLLEAIGDAAFHMKAPVAPPAKTSFEDASKKSLNLNGHAAQEEVVVSKNDIFVTD